MGIVIRPTDTPFTLAQELLGDGRMTHELVIDHWHGSGPLPVGHTARIKGERLGPPAQHVNGVQR